MDRLIRISLAIMLGLVMVPAAFAQQPAEKPQQPPPAQQPPAQQPPAQQPPPAEPQVPPVNQEEEDAYKAFFDAPRDMPQKQIELGEAFLAKFPDSRYRASVYARMVNAYLALGDVDKLFVAGEKALELNPDNVDVLAVVAYAVPRRIKPEDLDAAQKLQKVEQYSKHAVEVLNGLPKPETLTEEEFTRAKNEKLSMAHSGLAMVAFHRNNFTGMASELEQATTLSAAPDPSDFYLLGIAYDKVQRHGDAATAFGKCAAVPWDYQDRCKQSQEQSLKQAGVQPKP